MGLDMYVYKIKKAAEDAAAKCQNKTEEEIEKNFSIFYPDDPELIQPILPWLIPVNAKVKILDLEKLKRDFNIPENSHISGQRVGGGEYGWYFRDENGEGYKAILTDDNYEDYQKLETMTLYICDSIEELDYWRKNYDLQENLHHIYRNETNSSIENCGYYPISETMYEAIVDDYKMSGRILPDYPETNEDQVVCYHEWY